MENSVPVEENINFGMSKTDDNTHFEAIVISDDFTGESRIARHQLIYACLGNAVGNEIHALSIKAYTHNEWESLK